MMDLDMIVMAVRMAMRAADSRQTYMVMRRISGQLNGGTMEGNGRCNGGKRGKAAGHDCRSHYRTHHLT